MLGLNVTTRKWEKVFKDYKNAEYNIWWCTQETHALNQSVHTLMTWRRRSKVFTYSENDKKNYLQQRFAYNNVIWALDSVIILNDYWFIQEFMTGVSPIQARNPKFQKRGGSELEFEKCCTVRHDDVINDRTQM